MKFEKTCKKSIKDLTLEEKFYYFLCHATALDDKELALLAKDKIIKKAFEELDRFGWSDEELSYYNAATKKERDYRASMDYQKDAGIKIGRTKEE